MQSTRRRRLRNCLLLTVLFAGSAAAYGVVIRENSSAIAALTTLGAFVGLSVFAFLSTVSTLTKTHESDHGRISTLLKNGQLRRLRKRQEVLNQELSRWRSIDPEILTLVDLLRYAMDDERSCIAGVLKTRSTAPIALADVLRATGSHTIGVVKRRLLGQEAYVGYREIVAAAYKRVLGSKLSIQSEAQCSSYERSIVERLFDATLNELSPEQRGQLAKSISQVAAERGERFTGLVTVSSVMAIASASGFGPYLVASTVVGVMSHAIGITLPFAFYTTMSSTIALLIGPIGWAALGVWLVHRLGGPDLRRTTAAIAFVAYIRARVRLTKDAEVARLIGAVQELENAMRVLTSRKSTALHQAWTPGEVASPATTFSESSTDMCVLLRCVGHGHPSGSAST